MDLKTLIDKKNSLTEISNREVLPGFNSVAIQGVVNRAKIDLEQLKYNYVTEAFGRTVFIAVVGDQAEQFAELSQDLGCFVVNANSLYKRVANKISDAYIGQNMSQQIIQIAQAELEEVAREANVISMEMMILNASDISLIQSREDLEKKIATLINQKIGHEINAISIASAAAQEAYLSGFTGKNVPIVVIGDESLVLEIPKSCNVFCRNNVTVVAGESDTEAKIKLKEVNTETVEKAFLSIKKLLK